MSNRTQGEQEFIERFGLMIETEGLPRIAGRIMGFLLLNDGACRAAELASELRISHGSVSTNTRLLERLGVVEKVSIPGDRAAFYQMTNDPYGSVLAGQLERMVRIHGLVADTRRALPPSRATGHHRLSEIERFYRMAIQSTQRLLEGWAARAMGEPYAEDGDPRAKLVR